jgi:hypothetical protein
MFKDIFASISSAARKLFTNWGATLIALFLYALLLAVVYVFFTTGVGTVTHVILSLVVLPLAAAVLFFVLQAYGVSYVRIGVGPGYLLRRAFQDCWKLLLVSLPLIVLAGLLVWGFSKLDGLIPPYEESKQWLRTTLAVTRFLVLYFVLPLLAIHLWIAAVREGAAGAYRGFARNAARAFAPRSLAIYGLLYTVFYVAVQFLLFTKTQFGGAWAELVLLSVRIGLALILIFIGWFVTVGALAEVTALSGKPELE